MHITKHHTLIIEERKTAIKTTTDNPWSTIIIHE